MTRLQQYLRSKREDQALLDADAARIREEWLHVLDDLMARIDQWLEPCTQEGLMIRKESVSISEKRLGTYTAPKRVIEFGTGQVVIEPKARLIVGGHGRVDIRSGVDTALLIHSRPEREWSIVQGRDWMRRERLTQESFEQLLEAFL